MAFSDQVAPSDATVLTATSVTNRLESALVAVRQVTKELAVKRVSSI